MRVARRCLIGDPIPYGEPPVKPRLVVVALLVGSFLGLTAWRLTSDTPAPPAPASQSAGGPETSPPPPETSAATATTATTLAPVAQRVGYVTSRPGTHLAPFAGETGREIASGIVFPVIGEIGGGYRVLDSCNDEGWVAAADVDAGEVPAEVVEGFHNSVFVIDPGHGLPDYGAVGPTGLAETEVNLAVASRVVDLLRSPHDVDWETGRITPGDSVPAAAVAILTRGPEGPNGGDFQLGLTFRSTLANAVDATALVSIHHNTVPETILDHPGSEAFVSANNPASPRLGGLIVEELRREFARFDVNWTGSPGAGLTSRVSDDGSDYYSLLRRSEVPAVIVEGAYISNPSEEELARTNEFRQAYADAVYRGMVRFVTTTDDPIPPPEPILWDDGRPSPSLSSCEVPGP